MKVLRSEAMGFCSGVSRAMKEAFAALEADSSVQEPKKIYSLGPLIHNQAALDRLKQKGLAILEEGQTELLDKDSVVIVRAHGVSPFVLERIKKSGARVVDATCPRVALSQRRAAEFSKKGAFVFLAGDSGHAEVKAVEGSALFAAGRATKDDAQSALDFKGADGLAKSGRFFLIQNEGEAEALESLPQMDYNSVLLSQTTFSPKEFEKIKAALQKKIRGLETLSTICPATEERQAALERLSKKVDAIVVVGGKKSANSGRLFLLAKSLCPASFFVESADDLPNDFLGASVVGLTAGASAPDFVIDQVEEKILHA